MKFPAILSQSTTAILAVCASLLPHAAHAGTPYNVDDADTPDPRHYEINLAYISSQTGGDEQQQVPWLEVNYGYNDRLELVTATGTISARSSGEPRRTSLSDTTLEAKWRFLDETSKHPEIAFDGAVDLLTASYSEGLSTGRADYSPELIAGKTYGRWIAFADAGYVLVGSRDETSNLFGGIAITNQVSSRTVAGLQIYGNTSAAPDQSAELAYGVGLEQTVAPDRILQFQIGRSTEGLSNLNVYAGIQIILGPRTDGTSPTFTSNSLTSAATAP